MSGTDDPRFERLLTAVHVLEARQAEHDEAMARLRDELAAAHREVAEARETAAYAKAETASYQAELSALVRRGDLDRLAERLDETDAAVDAIRRSDATAGQLREQILKLGRALNKVAAASDVAELARRVEQIDDRAQARTADLVSRVETSRGSIDELQSVVAQLSADTGDVGQSLDKRVGSLEDAFDDDRTSEVTERLDLLSARLDGALRAVDDDLGAATRRVDERVRELAARVDAHDARLEAGGGEATDELGRSVAALRAAAARDRRAVDDLEGRVFGSDGVAARLMQLAEVVVDLGAGDRVTPATDATLLELQGRLESVATRVEGIATLRARVDAVEQRLGLD